MKKFSLFCALFLGANLVASGYKIPEQSGDSIALAGSNYAFSFGADAAYYNPANMMFMYNTWHQAEFGLTYFHLGKTSFENRSKVPGTKSVTSRDFGAFAPQLHFISPEYIPNWRFGLAFALPAGVEMRWDDEYPKAIAQKFDLKIFEFNPSAAYRINDNVALGAGARIIYARGEVENSIEAFKMSRKLQGSSLNLGYNLALSINALQNLAFSATYRSKVDMKLKGDGDFKLNAKSLKTKADVSIPLPASLVLGLGYKFKDFTLLFAYEKTFWSAYKELDFNYKKDVFNGYNTAKRIFDDPAPKNWHDSDTYRFGVAWDANDKFRLMAGFAIDESPANSDKIGFELPIGKAYIYSTGLNYKLNDRTQINLAHLYQYRKDVELNTQKANFIGTIQGKLKNANASLTNLTLRYDF